MSAKCNEIVYIYCSHKDDIFCNQLGDEESEIPTELATMNDKSNDD